MTTKVPATMCDDDLATQAELDVVNNSAVKLTGDQTVAGVKTFSSQPVVPAPSRVRLNTANGYGSTNTAIRRFTNTVTNQGSDITYADSATLGASFTINTNGVYAITYTDCFTGVGSFHGISVDSNQLTTSVATITAANRLTVMGDPTGNYGGPASWTGYLTAGQVIRPHAVAAVATGTMPQDFTITRIS